MYIRQPLLNNHLVNNHLVNRNPHPVALQGIDIGIPLNIFSNIYTNLHYGYDITTINSICLQFLLGFYSYGTDRVKDALEYKSINNTIQYTENKITLYRDINDNIEQYKYSLYISLAGITYILCIDNYDVRKLPFLLLLYLAGNYKEYKQYLNIYKPLFIATMWTLTTVILPCVIHDNDYSILSMPQDYLPCLLFIFSASNFADSNDIEEDKVLGVDTIPVTYGVTISNTISFIAVTIAAVMLIESRNFENRFIINSLIEMQHLGLMYLLYNNTFIN